MSGSDDVCTDERMAEAIRGAMKVLMSRIRVAEGAGLTVMFHYDDISTINKGRPRLEITRRLQSGAFVRNVESVAKCKST